MPHNHKLSSGWCGFCVGRRSNTERANTGDVDDDDRPPPRPISLVPRQHRSIELRTMEHAPPIRHTSISSLGSDDDQPGPFDRDALVSPGVRPKRLSSYLPPVHLPSGPQQPHYGRESPPPVPRKNSQRRPLHRLPSQLVPGGEVKHRQQMRKQRGEEVEGDGGGPARTTFGRERAGTGSTRHPSIRNFGSSTDLLHQRTHESQQSHGSQFPAIPPDMPAFAPDEDSEGEINPYHRHHPAVDSDRPPKVEYW